MYDFPEKDLKLDDSWRKLLHLWSKRPKFLTKKVNCKRWIKLEKNGSLWKRFKSVRWRKRGWPYNEKRMVMYIYYLQGRKRGLGWKKMRKERSQREEGKSGGGFCIVFELVSFLPNFPNITNSFGQTPFIFNK